MKVRLCCVSILATVIFCAEAMALQPIKEEQLKANMAKQGYTITFQNNQAQLPNNNILIYDPEAVEVVGNITPSSTEADAMELARQCHDVFLAVANRDRTTSFIVEDISKLITDAVLDPEYQKMKFIWGGYRFVSLAESTGHGIKLTCTTQAKQ